MSIGAQLSQPSYLSPTRSYHRHSGEAVSEVVLRGYCTAHKEGGARHLGLLSRGSRLPEVNEAELITSASRSGCGKKLCRRPWQGAVRTLAHESRSPILLQLRRQRPLLAYASVRKRAQELRALARQLLQAANRRSSAVAGSLDRQSTADRIFKRSEGSSQLLGPRPFAGSDARRDTAVCLHRRLPHPQSELTLFAFLSPLGERQYS